MKEKPSFNEYIAQRYTELTSRVTRREALAFGMGTVLGGIAVALAMNADNEYTMHTGEKERQIRFAKGIDYSWPQGSAEQFAGMRHDFVIVGVNGGKPGVQNPHLAEQLRVASVITQDADPAQTGMLPIQLYLNTANPADYIGTEHLKSWPTSNDSDMGDNPYGECDGTDSHACMYVYGWQRAKESVEGMFTVAAAEAGVSDNPTDYTVWLDIEGGDEDSGGNSWRKKPREGENLQESNKVVLEGMVAYLQSRGVGVGLYAARDHWNELFGDVVGEDSNLYYLPTWLATGDTPEEEVKKMLSEEKAKPFTRGGKVAIVQRVEGESATAPDALDYNYAIAPSSLTAATN